MPEYAKTIAKTVVHTIEFLAIVFGIAVIIHDFKWVLPKERELQNLHLNIEVAKLADREDTETVSPTIQHILQTMHNGGAKMTGIAVPNDMEFFMAEFEGVRWQRVIMNDVEFSCSDQEYDRIRNWEEGSGTVSFCTRLRSADFTGASLRKARFKYVDLREAKFTAADLTKARIQNSVFSDAKFLEKADLRGIKIKNSDFSRTQFSPEAEFRCTVMNKGCVKLRRSDFSLAVMSGVRFRGVQIDKSDFTGTKLKDARFDCERVRDGKKRCTILKNLCLQGKDTDLTKSRFDGARILNVNFVGANLSKTRFENTMISNANFSDADLSGARFRNVQFDRVVLTEKQEGMADLDELSHASLQEARRENLGSEYPDEIPCSTEWRRDIKGWKDRFELPG